MSAITEAWVKCVKHTARGDHVPSADEAAAVQQARAHADSQALRRSLAQAEQARLRESTAQWQAATAAALAQPMEEPVRGSGEAEQPARANERRCLLLP